ncbi:hypothetical protein GOFOIKOB_5453 [Methylobacterium tardum]|jgi:hypothetical protein|uniref:Uncharacterized protein n=1 Tax=Methylobacterium tardum TaxID=374432 RepID=A0AA37T8R3_9HYPH|nr:hypothetical protein [Methylobacterium tardum]GJE52382.1 hypothetical protein GOFOIKOB_5453 [Methylobacterium tardum]GLS68990.1 hypothetical protein GCM10007890_10020 [Methylobacterium tardum]
MPVSINDAQRKDAAERVAANQGQPSANQGFSSAEPPQAPKGLSTPLHPGGTRPGGGPAAGAGSMGTGGGQDADEPTGSLKSAER